METSQLHTHHSSSGLENRRGRIRVQQGHHGADVELRLKPTNSTHSPTKPKGLHKHTMIINQQHPIVCSLDQCDLTELPAPSPECVPTRNPSTALELRLTACIRASMYAPDSTVITALSMAVIGAKNAKRGSRLCGKILVSSQMTFLWVT